MHYAKIENSDRLKRVLRLLKGDEWWSTMEIIQWAHVAAVNSIISELRRNGYNIECKCKGKGIYWYRLIK